ncbi:uncharacterized protein LOC105663535 isoform X2 [Megachile rotundata]|uniref:uncharacterized protein LOC105663535 isoform X2 n=1 Tax=Megachile rotundata TaxID=143995 RepID=UPI003FD640A8
MVARARTIQNSLRSWELANHPLARINPSSSRYGARERRELNLGRGLEACRALTSSGNASNWILLNQNFLAFRIEAGLKIIDTAGAVTVLVGVSRTGEERSSTSQNRRRFWEKVVDADGGGHGGAERTGEDPSQSGVFSNGSIGGTLSQTWQ